MWWEKNLSVTLAWGLAIILSACAHIAPQVPEVTATPQVFTQWAASAEASSQFGYPDWSARRATGAPEVNACRDDSRAWASARGGGLQWLLLTYAQPVYANEVVIHQTFGRGAISKVLLVSVDGATEEIWSGADSDSPCPGVLSVAIPRTAYKVAKVRIELDESRTNFWNQIDAVALVGER
ncbi:MAG TPA: hypothetical protein PKH77_04470 [Anaerolineae bacterium]|nr:hypothetical protein [Anaerolineae bacterium]